jgi:hypothetical protein
VCGTAAFQNIQIFFIFVWACTENISHTECALKHFKCILSVAKIPKTHAECELKKCKWMQTETAEALQKQENWQQHARHQQKKDANHTTWQGANNSKETNNRTDASNSETPWTLETTVTEGTSSSWDGNNSRDYNHSKDPKDKTTAESKTATAGPTAAQETTGTLGDTNNC